MTPRLPLLVPLLAAVAPLAAQQQALYYKFDDFGATEVSNHGNHPDSPPFAGSPFGQLGDSTYTDGKFGDGALKASPFAGASFQGIESHWAVDHVGSFTVAWHLRNRSSTTFSPVSAFFSRPDADLTQSGFLLATSDFSQPTSDNNSIWLHGWGGPAIGFQPPTPLSSISGWHHVALVIDAASNTASWYWDGNLEQSSSIPNGVVVPDNGKTMQIGGSSTNFVHCGNGFDTDEFRVLLRAATPLEIGGWVDHPSPSNGPVPVPDDSLDHPTFDVPFLGNDTYSLNVSGPPNQMAIVLFSEETVAPVSSLPILGLPGAFRVQPSVLLFGQTDATGQATIALPIPNFQVLEGYSFHTQAVTVDGMVPTGISAGVTHSIGR